VVRAPIRSHRASPVLLRAAVATAFNEPETAERLLRDVVKSAPASKAADDAYDLLLRMYMRSGQYRRWVTAYRQWVGHSRLCAGSR
jgi:hypothetical protein